MWRHLVVVEAMAAGALVACFAVVAVWPVVRSVVTAVHEAGHAIVAVLLRGKVSTIRVRRDTSGETTFVAPRSRVRSALCAAAGYPAPLVLGVAASGALAARQETVLLFALAGVVVLSVPLWRGWWTVVVGAVCAALLAAAAVAAGMWATFAVAAVASLGVVGGLRAAFEAVMRPTHRDDGSDVAAVAQSLFLPVVVSRAGLLSAAVTLAVAGVWLFCVALGV